MSQDLSSPDIYLPSNICADVVFLGNGQNICKFSTSKSCRLPPVGLVVVIGSD
jgi:hypothetical protein